RQMLSQAKSRARDLRLEFQRGLVIFRFPDRHPYTADREVFEYVGTTGESGDVIGVPVSHNNEFYFTTRRLCHVTDSGFNASDITRLVRALEDAAVDDDMKRLCSIIEICDEKKIAETHSIHAHPNADFSSLQPPFAAGIGTPRRHGLRGQNRLFQAPRRRQ